MDNSNRFTMMIEALTELVQEEQVTSLSHQTPPGLDQSTLRSVIADISPLPRGALFLGMAEDGLPVLLNLYDPIPGPILVAGDPSSGKTALLQTIARAVDILQTPDEVQYGIITQYPDQWENFYKSRNCAGIFSTKDANAPELLQSLVSWAHRNKGEGLSILLLIDGLYALTDLDAQVQQNLRWLLLRGPSRRVWPIITSDLPHARDLKEWMEFFHTRLFSHIEDPDDAYFITGNREQTLDHLTAGAQFAMREGSKLLGFRLPPVD
jgi:hypothetical protein